MFDTAIIVAHPDLETSRANRILLEKVESDDRLIVSRLYQQYPDFKIDVQQEQAKLSQVRSVVFQFPLYWYSSPALLKEWIDRVFSEGFAYGENANGLKGKNLMVAITLGADASFCAETDEAGQPNVLAFSNAVKPFEALARYCSMIWQPAFSLFGVPQKTDEQLREEACLYHQRLSTLP